jgi:tartrate-resistant acid phosphatase type 5
MRSVGLAIVLASAACGSAATGVGDDDDDDSPADSGGGGGDGSGGNPDAPPGPRTVRFVALGDTGEGNAAQAQVAAAMKTVCDSAGGCDFALLLGDNIYDSGVSGVDDMQWDMKFEVPYQNLDFPFYAALGNHDYGGTIIGLDVGGLGNEFDKGPLEVMYTDHSDKWEMPDTHYTIKRENLGIIVLDTNSILWSNTDHGDQRAWYPSALAELEGTDWKIAAGHHPYRSNGEHGNAGNYDAPELFGIPIPNPLPIQNGNDLKNWFDDVVCGTVDIYICGHDHERQWLNEPSALCGAELIVSGAGAKLTGLREDRGNAHHWQDDTKEGFFLFEITGKRLVGRAYDKDGVMNFERVLMKQ